MRTLLAVSMAASLGCDYLKEKPSPQPTTNIRCEQVSAPGPDIPEDRRKRLDEIADLNSYIDLEIARHDKKAIDQAIEMHESAAESYRESRDKHLSMTEQGKRLKWSIELSGGVDEALEAAAKHRHR